MVKEWATVVRWQQGRALLRYGASSGCGSCQAKAACGSYLLEKIGPEKIHQLELEIPQPLQPGQKVEVGIPESSLLRSAMLVYLTPLLGLFLGGIFLQYWTSDQLWICLGGLAAGLLVFSLLAKSLLIGIIIKHTSQ
ncbi:positive regulator for alginate biosynthesis MucC [Xenorhabdus szentirmaii]|nr:positive regulator for alginate biosynthesis MucC [Xenorhabdus szentirmaii]